MKLLKKTLLTLGCSFVLQAHADVFINEIHYDNVGQDVDEFIEVTAPAGEDLSDWSVVLYNGNNSAKYKTVSIADAVKTTSNQRDFYVISLSGFQNGAPDGLALVNNGVLVQFLSYEGSLTATDGPANGEASIDISVSESNNTSVGDSLQLSGSGTSYIDFTWQSPAVNTKGAINNGQTFSITPPSKSISITATDANKAEGNSGDTAFTFTVSRSDSSGSASVDYTVLGSDTLDASDFGGTLPTGNVMFVDTESSKTVTINVSGDIDIESDETFTVTLSHATSGWLIGESSASGTIQDDDTSLTMSRIHDIQGAGYLSDMDGQEVVIEGIVVGDFQNGDADEKRNLGGFFIQEEDSNVDADSMTSEGIFIYEDNMKKDVNIGDKVQIIGQVTEFSDQTQIKVTDESDIFVDSSNNTMPTPANVRLPAQNTIKKTDRYGNTYHIPDLEAYESMLVTLEDTLTITEMYQLGKLGEIKLSQGGRLEQFTQINTPDPVGYDAHLVDVGKRTIVYEDGLTGMNNSLDLMDGFVNPDTGKFDTGTDVRMGDTVTDLTGVMTYGFDQFRIHSTQDNTVTFDKNNPRELSPLDVGGTLKFASFNVLNYFTTLNEGSTKNTCSPSRNMECRGANSALEFTRQRNKIITAISAMNVDVVGLMELENTDDTAIQDLVTGLNARMGANTYSYVNSGTISDDAIRVALIYKPDTVELDGAHEILDSTIDPNFIDNKNRPVLAQTFIEKTSGEKVTVAVVHLKSKGSSCESLGDHNLNDGQANCSGTRTKAVTALKSWLETDPTGSGSTRNLLLGDFNTYAKEDPVTTLEAAPNTYTNLMSVISLRKQVSQNLNRATTTKRYTFNAQVGTLDYAFVNADLLPNITGVTEWHINGDEASVLDYNLDFGKDPAIFDDSVPFRASDHDPVIVGLTFSKKAVIFKDSFE